MRSQLGIMAERYESVWDGREALTGFPEKDWDVLNRAEEIYWPPPVVVDWREILDGRGWGVVAIGNTLRRWMRGHKLRTGTRARHVKRRIVEGQRPNAKLIGERARNVKLEEQDVLEMRRLYRCDGLSFNKISKRFGVSTPTVAQIINGDTWKHLPLKPPQSADAVDPQVGSSTE